MGDPEDPVVQIKKIAYPESLFRIEGEAVFLKRFPGDDTLHKSFTGSEIRDPFVPFSRGDKIGPEWFGNVQQPKPKWISKLLQLYIHHIFPYGCDAAIDQDGGFDGLLYMWIFRHTSRIPIIHQPNL